MYSRRISFTKDLVLFLVEQMATQMQSTIYPIWIKVYEMSDEGSFDSWQCIPQKSFWTLRWSWTEIWVYEGEKDSWALIFGVHWAQKTSKCPWTLQKRLLRQWYTFPLKYSILSAWLKLLLYHFLEGEGLTLRILVTPHKQILRLHSLHTDLQTF